MPTLAEAILNASILGTWTGPKLKGEWASRAASQPLGRLARCC